MIRKAGTQKITNNFFHFHNEIDLFDTTLHEDLRNLELTLEVTNFVHEPKDKDVGYSCYLTRIDDFSVKFNNYGFSRTSGIIKEDKQGDYEEILKKISALLDNLNN